MPSRRAQSARELEIAAGEVIDYLSKNCTEKIKLPPRLASSVQGNLEIMEQDISTLKSLVQEKIAAYRSSFDEDEKNTLAREINESLLRIE